LGYGPRGAGAPLAQRSHWDAAEVTAFGF